MEAVYLSWIQQRIIPWVYVQVYPSNMQAIKGNAFYIVQQLVKFIRFVCLFAQKLRELLL